MAYSFPPRGFSVNQSHVSTTENCEVPVHFTEEESHYSNYNCNSNTGMNDNLYLGYPPGRPFPGPHCNQFPAPPVASWNNPMMYRPGRPRPKGPRSRPRCSGPPFPMPTFDQRCNFVNNSPRPCGPRFQGAPKKNGHPFSNQKNNSDKRSQSIQNEQPAKKRSRKNPRKQDLAESFEFFCDMCDRGFKTNENFQIHIDSHIKCDYPGCKFEGAFKIVKQHKGMQHTPNSKPIGPLETVEEIEKWREERRKRYPTAFNVRNKATELSERIKTGNVLKTKEFGKMKHKTEITEKEKPNLETKKPEEIKNLGSLGSLMSAYGSDSEKSSSEEGEIKEVRKPITQADNIVHKKFDWQERRKQRKKEMKVKRNKKKIESCKRKNLLEMLLAGDIRRERNVLLQCVRHIVSRGFFEKSNREANQKLHTSSDTQAKLNSKNENAIISEDSSHSKNQNGKDTVENCSEKTTIGTNNNEKNSVTYTIINASGRNNDPEVMIEHKENTNNASKNITENVNYVTNYNGIHDNPPEAADNVGINDPRVDTKDITEDGQTTAKFNDNETVICDIYCLHDNLPYAADNNQVVNDPSVDTKDITENVQTTAKFNDRCTIISEDIYSNHDKPTDVTDNKDMAVNNPSVPFKDNTKDEQINTNDSGSVVSDNSSAIHDNPTNSTDNNTVSSNQSVEAKDIAEVGKIGSKTNSIGTITSEKFSGTLKNSTDDADNSVNNQIDVAKGNVEDGEVIANANYSVNSDNHTGAIH